MDRIIREWDFIRTVADLAEAGPGAATPAILGK
jgi:hypothetical protein